MFFHFYNSSVLLQCKTSETDEILIDVTLAIEVYLLYVNKLFN